MRIKHKKSKKSIILITLAAVIIAAGGLSYYVFAMNGSLFGWKFRADSSGDLGKPVESTNFDPPSQEQKDAGADVKQSTVENAEKEDQPVSSLDVSFTTTSQNGDTLRIRAEIQPLVSGSCKLTLQKGSTIVTKTASTYAMASIATCQGFDVPVSELSSGTWNVTLDVTAGSATGKATTSTQVQ